MSDAVNGEMPSAESLPPPPSQSDRFATFMKAAFVTGVVIAGFARGLEGKGLRPTQTDGEGADLWGCW